MSFFPSSWSRQRKGWVIAGAVIVVFLATRLGSSDTSVQPQATRSSQSQLVAAQPTAPPAAYTVEYIIKTADAAPIDIDWNNETEGLEHSQGIVLLSNSWTKSFQMQPGTFAYITANLRDAVSGMSEISCEVRINGQQVEFKHAAGAYGSVTCSTRVGR